MIKQPTKNTCGQTCIAWYLNIPVSEVIAAMGDRKTYPRDLRKYLETHGVKMEQRHGGKFHDDTVMPFGKYKGWSLGCTIVHVEAEIDIAEVFKDHEVAGDVAST